MGERIYIVMWQDPNETGILGAYTSEALAVQKLADHGYTLIDGTYGTVWHRALSGNPDDPGEEIEWREAEIEEVTVDL